MYPNWASEVVASQKNVNGETRVRFVELINQTKKPGAFTGRPTLTENATAAVSPNTKTR